MSHIETISKPAVPNLFSFATKELAQDAALAYIISWTDPEYKDTFGSLHRLGTELLSALLNNASPVLQIPAFNSVRVETQFNRIDILVRINDDEIVLLIEDKIDASEHSNQVERYKEVAKECFTSSKIVAVYLKTGNVSRWKLPPEEKCGHFLRTDLLAVLNNHCETGDTIIENLHVHLKNFETITNQYLEIPVDCWPKRDWKIYEGFYNDLEERMKNWESGGSWGWKYVNNPTGGFLCLNFGAQHLPGTVQADLAYFQIENATRLTLRLGGWDTNVRIRNLIMYRAYSLLSEISKEFADIEIRKAGRFRGGDSAAVAEIAIKGQEDYIERSDDGTVDMQLTMKRIHLISEITAKLAVQLNDSEI